MSTSDGNNESFVTLVPEWIVAMVILGFIATAVHFYIIICGKILFENQLKRRLVKLKESKNTDKDHLKIFKIVVLLTSSIWTFNLIAQIFWGFFRTNIFFPVSNGNCGFIYIFNWLCYYIGKFLVQTLFLFCIPATFHGFQSMITIRKQYVGDNNINNENATTKSTVVSFTTLSFALQKTHSQSNLHRICLNEETEENTLSILEQKTESSKLKLQNDSNTDKNISDLEKPSHKDSTPQNIFSIGINKLKGESTVDAKLGQEVMEIETVSQITFAQVTPIIFADSTLFVATMVFWMYQAIPRITVGLATVTNDFQLQCCTLFNSTTYSSTAWIAKLPVIAFGIFDIIIGIATLVIFVSKINQLLANVSDCPKIIAVLFRRLVLLRFISILSTIGLYLLAFIQYPNITFIFAVDATINSICVLCSAASTEESLTQIFISPFTHYKNALACMKMIHFDNKKSDKSGQKQSRKQKSQTKTLKRKKTSNSQNMSEQSNASTFAAQFDSDSSELSDDTNTNSFARGANNVDIVDALNIDTQNGEINKNNNNNNHVSAITEIEDINLYEYESGGSSVTATHNINE